MRKFLPMLLCSLLFFLSLHITHDALAQKAQKPLPTDAYLLSLVSKNLHTPVIKTTKPTGEVFLQRDMTDYLQSSVFTGREPEGNEIDHGHDHKDAMLREFLNRPHPSRSTMDAYFDNAARDYHVPVSILKATAQVQSNWAQVSESMYGSWGVMGLVENQFTQQISKAALLLNVSTDAIKNDANTNIRAAAALLAFYQSTRPAPVNTEDWFASVKDLTGLKGEDMKSDLAERIYDIMQAGSKSVSLWGEIINIDAVNVSLDKADRMEESVNSFQNFTAAVDYPNAVSNFTTCNYNGRPAGANINYYFVHYVATGTYQGAVDWFKNCTSQVSAHYVVRNFDGEVSQVVAEANRAWSQGVTAYNDQGIGVEHEVLATNLAMWDSDPMLTSAANLCVNVCNRWGISKTRRVTNGDRAIYGHSDVKTTDCPNLTPARWSNFLNRLTAVNAATPTLYSIENPGAADVVKATWKANTEPTLAGYRLYYATTDALTTWALAADETTLGPTSTSVTMSAAQFVVPPSGNVYHFKLTAVVADGANPLVESNASDVYSRSSNTTGPKVLIVDGFDRFGGSGSYPNSTHIFNTSYFKALRNKGDLQISSVANEKVEDGTVLLNGYNIVVWYIGDESTTTIALSTMEKNAIKAFLENGGKLIISGSEIAYSLGRTGSTTIDLSFFNSYLKATYLNDGSAAYTPAIGVTGTGFEGLNLPFGLAYPEDFPDAINPAGGSVTILNYNVSPNKAGVAYKGTFGTGTTAGAVIYLSFALETAADSSIAAFIGKALPYFDVPVISRPYTLDDAAIALTATAKRINVLANDLDNGVAFNQATLALTQTPTNGTVAYDNAGNVTYTSAPGYVGNDQFQYTIQNTNGQVSNAATVYVTVNADQPCNPIKPEVEDAYPKRDLRGSWIASVYNLDWPSQRTLSTPQQQAQLLRMLDSLVNAGINAVYFQVRPESDALYQSSIDPWSYWLTNAQGTAPSPFWDPLTFAVEQAHKRGMELHAWINPYRAKQGTPVLASNHVATLHPDWTFVAGTVTLLNPGIPEVKNYLTNVIADIARRYDVDGIHFDDYFYPTGMGTQDATTFTANNPGGLSLADWRRNNVNQLIAKVYDTIAVINSEANRNVLFGVSPFGIWKVQNPPGITGQSSFNDLYCDPIAWMQAGKVDYIAPQLYWKISGPQDYISLSKWWNGQGALYDRPIYIGVGVHRLTGTPGWPVSEITNQILVNRSATHDQIKGQIIYSSKYLVGDSLGVKTTLQNSSFKYKAIPPVLPFKDAVCPNPPANIRIDSDTLRWDTPAAAADGDLPRRYIVYRFNDATDAATHKNDPKNIYAILYDNKLSVPSARAANNYYIVNSLDKNNNESEGSNLVVLPLTGLELNVTLSGNVSLIKWTTLTEINTHHFEVEKSTDGRNFTYMSSVTAAGNSNSGRSYFQQDPLMIGGTYYYRIKAVDIDGRASYSVIRTVTFENDANRLLVGPNPFTNTINISSLSGFRSIELFDVTGRVLLTRKLKDQSTLKLDIPTVPAGVYFLRATKENGEKVSIKLVRQ